MRVSIKLGIVVAGAIVCCRLAWDYGRQVDSSASPALPKGLHLRAVMFRETLEDHRILYDFADHRDAYLRTVRATPKKVFSHYRICDLIGYPDTPEARNERKRAIALSEYIRPRPEGGVICPPSYRTQLYHSEFMTWKRIPLVPIEGMQALAFEVEYKILRSADHTAAGSWSTRFHLIWCNGKGKPLLSGSQSRLSLRLYGNVVHRWIREQVRDIPIPFGARTVRIDWQIPSADTVHFRNYRLLGAGIRREMLSQPHAELRSQQSDRHVRVAARFRSENPLSHRLVAQGVELAWDNVLAAEILNRRHEPTGLAVGSRRLLGRFRPQALLVTDRHGVCWRLLASECDAIDVRFNGDRITARFCSYYAPERYYTVISEVTADGNRVQKNLGITDRVEAQNVAIQIAEGDEVVVPCWQPRGCPAALILTEHADKQCCDTDRLLLYGNPQGRLVEGAGLLGNHIAFSKTVFTTGRNNNAITPPPDAKCPWGTLEEPGYARLIRRMLAESDQVQIGLHTPSYRDDSADVVRQGLARIQAIGGDLWIDHSDGSNRECLRRLGWNRECKDYYVLPMLRKFGIRYAWSYRDFLGIGLNCLRQNKASNLLFYQPKLDDDLTDDWRLTMFSTKRVVFKPQTFAPAALDQLIAERGISVVHCYFSYNRHGHLVLRDGKPVALADWFAAGLTEIARRRDAGKLYLATLRDWAEHVAAVRSIRISPHKDGGFLLVNPIDHTIPGLTLALWRPKPLSRVLLNGTEVGNVRRGNYVVYCWVDLKPGRHRLLLQ